MSRRPTPGPGSLLALGLGGVLAGHTLTYRLLVPDAHARVAELARTGHGYLSGANAVGASIAIAALAVVFLGGVLGSPIGDGHGIARRLVAFQVAAFCSMEILERVATGSGAHDLAPLLLVGLPVQILVAVAIGALVRLLVGAGRAVMRSAREARRSPAALASIVSLTGSPSSAGRHHEALGRAPPQLLPV
jgi:hypothetical protein